QRLDDAGRLPCDLAYRCADGGTDLNRRALSAQRKPGTDRHSRKHELPNDRPQRQLFAGTVDIRGLDLGNPAATSERHDVLEQKSDDKADSEEEKREQRDPKRERPRQYRLEQTRAHGVYRPVERYGGETAQAAGNDRQREENV